ncbi:MAG TPA: TATA-box-binding protein [Thermoplasmatales archaeon]|nr:TATA-box-binding protein [Candidatus Thermoplasmatota archaeon]MDD5778229.1 TATA-box-binding protein [Candidatus Thermoplasmatota archaeon]HDS59895.1 TATA-box-binding protein [Thermoplasmatales archaeon]
MADITIQNIVASTTIADSLDLDSITRSIPNTSYRPGIFPGLVLRIPQPKTAFLLFKSGKVVCTGAKNLEDIKKSMKKVCTLLKKVGFKVVDEPEINVQNIVASGDLHGELNLVSTALAVGLENTEYEPEIFPGIVYRMEDLGVVLLLFSSGKIVCTGARKTQQVEQAVDQLRRELEAKGLLY